MKLDLNDEESEVLAETPGSYLSEPRAEIAHIDSRNFRDGLEHRRAVLERIAEALRERAA